MDPLLLSKQGYYFQPLFFSIIAVLHRSPTFLCVCVLQQKQILAITLHKNLNCPLLLLPMLVLVVVFKHSLVFPVWLVPEITANTLEVRALELRNNTAIIQSDLTTASLLLFSSE